MTTLNTCYQLFLLKYYLLLSDILIDLTIPIRDFLIPQKRRYSFRKRLSTP